MRWVVCVKPPDDHPGAVRVFGTFSDRQRADALCQKVRDAVEAQADWLDEFTGYAYVMPIEKPRIRQAVHWALGGA
jgi:hypothetical protein